jgi:multidrug efflux pump subunit AcrB
MPNEIKNTHNNLDAWFFWFWVRKHRVSFLAIFLVIAAGIFSLFTIPKESSPDIKFGIIAITTPYIWVNPTDIDSLITDKIEKEIKDIEWIKKITSTSSVGVSSIIVELHNGINTRDVLTDIKDEVDTISLPEDAEDTNVVEMSSSNELMFEVLLYGDAEKFSYFDLVLKSQVIKDNLEWNSGIASIDLWWADLKWFWSSSSSNDYEITVLLDKDKIDLLNLDLNQIASIIRSYNKNTPIWNFTIWDLHYDFRFDGELDSIAELNNIVLRSEGWSNVLLSDISEIKKEYKWERIQKLWTLNKKWLHYVSLVFNKAAGTNVFSVSDNAKFALEKLLESNSNFKWLDIMYTKDMSQLIMEDYSNLSSTATGTIILVFITILLFVWLRESIIASLLLPLSFLITFIVLDTLWLSLNFLTNFSLVLTLWIAIDTVIVIIEWASENIRLGYNRRSAVLLSVRDYKAPLIAWTLTTLVAFLPLMFLPGVMWKFLAYIPITIFSTLVAALLLSLTVSSALFVKFVKDSKIYHIDDKLEATFSEEQTMYLNKERDGKVAARDSKLWLRDRALTSLGVWYYGLLESVVVSRKKRLFVILAPIVFLMLTFVFISPSIGFTLFPASDQWVITWVIEWQKWTDKKVMERYLGVVDDAIYKIPELQVYYSSVSGNKIDIYIDLLDKNIRKDAGMRNVFEVEEEILGDLKKLESEGLIVSIETLKDGPPTGKAVWIKLIASNTQKVEDLKETASLFKEHFKTINGIKNVTTTSSESPGQFIFKFDKDKLAEASLTPNDILRSVYTYTNWVKAWSIKSEYEDNNIVLKISQFDTNLSPDDVNNLMISTANCVSGKCQKVRVWDFANYTFTKAVSSINRDKWKVSITVEADVLPGILPSEVQPSLLKYASDYVYPEGISYSSWWENEENKDLIVSTFKSLFIALFLIFGILVFQFNSYSQPAIVLYSVILALLGVNIWLFLTGNPYSMPFMIGFIALMWVVVNDAIILIDRINKNLAKGIESLHAVVWAGKARLQPIIVTTLTTIFWILPLAMQDEFWAWLGYTIVFWLFAGSSMTLFVIPSLYYEVFLRKKKVKKRS